MFNLYQTQSITKDLIETRQLRQCKLAFWFCIRKRNDYIQISNISYSSIIHESEYYNINYHILTNNQSFI